MGKASAVSATLRKGEEEAVQSILPALPPRRNTLLTCDGQQSNNMCQNQQESTYEKAEADAKQTARAAAANFIVSSFVFGGIENENPVSRENENKMWRLSKQAASCPWVDVLCWRRPVLSCRRRRRRQSPAHNTRRWMMIVLLDEIALLMA